MLSIANHRVANHCKPFLIAEIGANHNGDIGLAKKLIDAAKSAGWHAAKFQSWSSSSIFAREVYDQNFFMSDDYRNREDYTLEKIVDKFSLAFDQLSQLNDYCREVGITFCCTPFSKREVDFLVDDLEMPFIKVASMDCNNYPFLKYIASKGIPIVLSTGLASFSEIAKAVECCEEAGNRKLAILHCVSQYPPKLENVNLRKMDLLSSMYPDYAIGFSDHTIGSHIPLAAIARGASLIEKHITLDKQMFGWDHKVSATPDEMMQISSYATEIVTALGGPARDISAEDLATRASYRRSVVTARSIPAGKVIEAEDLDCKRPGTGLAPEWLPLIVGRTARRDLPADVVIGPEDF